MKKYEIIFEENAVKESKNFFLELSKKGTILKIAKFDSIKLDEKIEFAIVLKGKISESFISNNGGQKELYSLIPGDPFGELNYLEKFPIDTYFYAKEDSEIAIVKGSYLEDVIAKDPCKAKYVYNSLFSKYQVVKFQMINLVFTEAVCNIADTLYRILCSRNMSEKNEALIKMTQQNLSEIVGCNRATVAKSLNTLRDKGIIDFGTGFIKILNMEALREMSGNI